ncbi:hypothetical protein [uncultured Tenacibaculum sp.]|uniref:hypothetical protein n=1 Tax=uncultured Tenacibaculum sp. TaxID=174713 RepID=UPI002614C4AC|nr:hypothetical protein [uncultured Tenacibaculum sp.]
MLIRFLFSLITIFFFNTVYSQTCCSGGVPLSNNIGLPFLEKGGSQFGVFYDYNNLNTLNEGSKKLQDNSRLRITNSILFNFSYNITERLLVEGLISWVNQKREITGLSSLNLDETSGIGDGVLLLRYMILNKKNYSLITGIGGKIPIGSTEEVNDLGIRLNADLQPGSNSFDILFTSTFIKRFNFRRTTNVIGRLTYRKTGVNSEYQEVNEYKFGNEIQGFIGVSDSFLFLGQIINPSLSFKYRKAYPDKLNNTKIANTGGDWLFINPNFSLKITPKINFSTSLEVPLYANVDGIQLTPTYRINTGISIQFSKKNKKAVNLIQ